MDTKIVSQPSVHPQKGEGENLLSKELPPAHLPLQVSIPQAYLSFFGGWPLQTLVTSLRLRVLGTDMSKSTAAEHGNGVLGPGHTVRSGVRPRRRIIQTAFNGNSPAAPPSPLSPRSPVAHSKRAGAQDNGVIGGPQEPQDSSTKRPGEWNWYSSMARGEARPGTEFGY